MSFKNNNLGVIAYVSGFTLWHYKTQDKMSEIDTDYFPKKIVDLMACGDIFIINAGDGSYIKVVEEIKDTKVKLGNLK